MKKIIIILILSCIVTQIIGQGSAIPVINRQELQSLKSKITGTEYQLFVSLPMHYSAKDSMRYPVMYILDGNYSFPIAHSSRLAMDFYSTLENLIIVGIGYSWEQSFAPWFSCRWTDLTPTTNAKTDSFPGFLNLLKLSKGDLKSGGADKFILSIKTEIMPLIEKKYKTNGDNGIVGHSLGGLFVGYCLLKETKLFKRYGITSPSFWWDNGKIFELEKSFAEQNQSLPVKVFISAGRLEGDGMVIPMTKFASELRSHNYSGLFLEEQIFEKEDHVSVIPATISRALRVLYSKME